MIINNYMQSEYFKDIESAKGRLIGVGSEKRCYLNAINPERCLKISSRGKSSQIKREIKYFKFLEKRNIDASFLPKFYGVFEGKDYIGYEQECFLAKSLGGVYDNVWLLSEYIENSKSNEFEIKEELIKLKDEMICKNIICSDLSGSNILRVEIGSCARLVVIDGFGASEIFPICEYIKCIGRNKIERQWKKLLRRLERNFNNKYADYVVEHEKNISGEI